MTGARRGRTVGILVLLAVLLIGWLWWRGPGPTQTSGSVAPTRTQSSRTQAPRTDGMPVLQADQLPAEGQQVLRALREGGPFRYSKDGTVYQNRNGALPNRPRGHYREFTVATPGEGDRGARRLVVGGCGAQRESRRGGVWAQPCSQANEVFYTADHYESFRRVQWPNR